jgi:DNA-binding MarR family transcriptional regulator
MPHSTKTAAHNAQPAVVRTTNGTSGRWRAPAVAQFLALRAIATGATSGSELAQRAGVSGPAVSQLLSALAAAGLLERREMDEDRRRQSVALSASGGRVLASAQTLLRRRMSSLLAELLHPETDALARALPQVEATLSGTHPHVDRASREQMTTMILLTIWLLALMRPVLSCTPHP